MGSRLISGQALIALRIEGARLVDFISSAFGAVPDQTAPLRRRVVSAWNQGDLETDFIRRPLVLLADQEVTAPVFAARVFASTVNKRRKVTSLPNKSYELLYKLISSIEAESRSAPIVTPPLSQVS